MTQGPEAGSLSPLRWPAIGSREGSTRARITVLLISVAAILLSMAGLY